MGSTSYEILGNCEITLPNYMVMLELNKNATANPGPIIACGIVPNTTIVISMSNDGQFYELDASKFFNSFDVGRLAFPSENGTFVEFEKDEMIVVVESVDILKASQKIQMTGFEIGMNHEDKNFNLEKDHQGGAV